MTGKTELGASRWARVIARMPLLLSRHLWVWPFLGALALGLVGYWVRSRVEGATRAELASRLQTLLAADIAALRLWFTEKEADANSFTGDVRFQGAMVDLADLGRNSASDPDVLANSAPAQTLQQYLKPLLQSQQYLDYVVLSRDRRILASPYRRLVGRAAPRGYDSFLDRTLAGQMTISRPFAPFGREATASQRAEGPIMFVAAPVKATNGTVVAVLALRMKPEEGFTRVFSVARMGKTGEAYAFDRRGMMLTASRFDLELKALGLIPNRPEATTILNLRLLDPGVDLAGGEHPKMRRDAMPLTRMAGAAVLGEDGVDVLGYRNYRGVKVVGAWAWLPEFGMGVATEVSAQEAFQTLYLLRQAFLVLFLLLVLSGLAIFAFTLLVERLQASVRKSAVTVGRLGQYVLVQEIGRGANGMVYRARHALLRRPVAIKLLSPDLTNPDTAARFEHEVQITSQLTHPNTVSIYDYGHTPEGLFYYAMEYLSGINLDQLVRRFGPQPEGRVIHILRQACGSLAEAHRIGLIHRDIKPANIVLTRRGGVCDVVKVLDFGLVKARRWGKAGITTANAVVGTPHFMPPEAINTPQAVDGQSDVYSVGAVGYWLVTGKTLFDSEAVDELFEQQAKVMPLRPSQRLGHAVSLDLENLLMECLSKSPAERPRNAEVLDERLAACQAAGNWTASQGEQWWEANLAGIDLVPSASMAEKTLIIAPRN
jgi:tRNA A-37 threonylcarbamoyl transferase component Bud32